VRQNDRNGSVACAPGPHRHPDEIEVGIALSAKAAMEGSGPRSSAPPTSSRRYIRIEWSRSGRLRDPSARRRTTQASAPTRFHQSRVSADGTYSSSTRHEAYDKENSEVQGHRVRISIPASSGIGQQPVAATPPASGPAVNQREVVVNAANRQSKLRRQQRVRPARRRNTPGA